MRHLLLTLLALGSIFGSNDTLNTTMVQGSSTVLQNQETHQQFNSVEWETKTDRLQEFLSHQPGFYLRKFGAQGTTSSLTWRGMSSDYFYLSFAGITLNNADGSTSSLDHIPSEWSNTLHLQQGVLDASKPSGYLAAIELQPLQQQQNTIHYNLHYPMGQSWSLQLFFPEAPQLGSHLFYGNSFSNQFEYLNRNNTPYNTADDTFATIQNAETKQWTSFHSFALTSGLQLYLYESLQSGGIFGAEGRPTENASFEQTIAASSLEYNSKNHLFSLSYKFQNNQSRWDNTDRLYLFSPVPVQLNSFIHSLEPRYLYKFTLHSLKMNVGANPQFEWFLSRNQAHPNHYADWDARRIQLQNTLSAQYPLFKNHSLYFRGGVNLLQNTAQKQKDSYEFLKDQSVQYAYQALPFDFNFLWSHNYRIPTLVQRFGGSKGSLANADLKTEQLKLYQGQIKYTYSFLTLRTTLYIQDIDDKLSPRKTKQVIKWENTGKSRIAGIENSLEYQFDLLKGSAHYSFSKSQDQGEELSYRHKELPDSPQHSGFSDWTLHLGSFSPWLQWSYQSSTFRDRANLLPIPAIHRWNAGLYYHFNQSQISLRCMNLTGTYYENPYSSFPYPKREWALNLKTNF